MSILRLALKNAQARSGRSIIITIILTSMLISGALNIGVSMQRSYLQSYVDQYSDAHAKFSNLTMEQISFLKNRVEVEKYVLAIGLRGYARLSPDSPITLPIQSASPLSNDSGSKLSSGREPMAEDEIALLPHTAELLGVSARVGERFDLVLTDRGREPEIVSFVISGVFEEKPVWAAQNINNLIVSEAFVLQRAQLPEDYTETMSMDDYATLSVWYRSGYDPYQVTEQLAQLSGITQVRDARMNEGYLTAAMQSPKMLTPIIIALLLFILVGSLVIYNTFNIQLIRRVRQTGLLSVVGASRGQILASVYLEALLLTMIALPIGLFLGAAVMEIAITGVLGTAMPSVELSPTYSPIAFLIAVAVTLITVVVSVTRPAIRISCVAPIDAVQFSGSAESTARRRHFENIDLLRLSYINLWRNKSRTQITIITLGLCGALFIGVSTVGGSLLAGVETLAKRGMAGDMQITAHPSPDQDSDPALTVGFAAQIASIDGVIDVHPVYASSMIALDGGITAEGGIVLDTQILGYDDDMLKDQLLMLKEGAPTIEQMDAGAALFVDFNKDERLELDKHILLKLLGWDIEGNAWESPFEMGIVGLLDTDDMRASLDGLRWYTFIMAIDALLQADPSAEMKRLAIDVDGAKYEEVSLAIRQLCEDNELLYFQSLRHAIDEQRDNMINVLMLLYTIVFVLGLVGFLNLANTTLVGIEQRRVEFGVLSALGVDGDGLRKLLWCESQQIAIICTLLGITVGGILGYLGTQVLKNIGATYIRYTPPVWQCTLLVIVLFLIPYWISHRAGSGLSNESTVSLLRVE